MSEPHFARASTVREINLDFSMAKCPHEDAILHQISQMAVNSLSKNVDMSKIKGVLLTGSVASREGTVIDYDSWIVASDFDFIVYLDFIDFLRIGRRLQNLSLAIFQDFVKRRINTHVTFLPHTTFLEILSCFTKSRIYDYEFAFASKRIFGKTPSFSTIPRPKKEDALELAFTVVSELVFLESKHLSKPEESYLWAKRGLTLLNSAMIFVGASYETYEKRIRFARELVLREQIPINEYEIEILALFTDYKLTGSLQNLMKCLDCKHIDNLIRYQIDFLTNLTAKVIFFELMNLAGKPIQRISLSDFSLKTMKKNLPNLLEKYLTKSTLSLPSRLVGMIIYVLGLLSRNAERSEFFETFIFHRQSPKTILNVIITLMFIYGHDFSARALMETRVLTEIFPWIAVPAPANRKIFSLWQTSEQSIKLN